MFISCAVLFDYFLTSLFLSLFSEIRKVQDAVDRRRHAECWWGNPLLETREKRRQKNNKKKMERIGGGWKWLRIT
jgi:hypothetical protein